MLMKLEQDATQRNVGTRNTIEGQHELMLLNLLNSYRNPYPPQMMDFCNENNSGPSSSESSYFDQSSQSWYVVIIDCKT